MTALAVKLKTRCPHPRPSPGPREVKCRSPLGHARFGSTYSQLLDDYLASRQFKPAFQILGEAVSHRHGRACAILVIAISLASPAHP